MMKSIRLTACSCGFWLLLTLASILGGCGGGGGGTDLGTTDPISTPPDTPTETTTPTVAGFDFTLQQGDFWEYGWDYHSSYTAATGSSSSGAASHFRITLGTPKVVDGITFYEMLISGNTKSNEYGDLTPNGKYLGIANNQLVTLAADGTTQRVIFDAGTGVWPGSGYFTTFPDTTLFAATSSTISNNYLNEAAYRVSESTSSSQCEYFPGVGTVCGGDYNQDMDSREYYQAGVGPVGYYAYFSMSDLSSPDGGWSSSNTTNIGLTASSLRGDAVDYQLEVEPNNLISQATVLTLPARVKGDSASEAYLGGTTAVPVSAAVLTELEPNDSPLAPQVLNLPASLSGDVLEGDSSTAVSVQTAPGGTSYTATFEDWYRVTLGSSATLSCNLDFAGTGADLDLYLFTFDGASSLTTQANSVNDNLTSGNYSEQISQALPAGTYYLAVDGFNTPARAAYTLSISNGASLNVGDWYSFTLTAPTQVSIAVSGGPSFVVTDASGSTTLASGGAMGTTLSLAAGSYLIGVGGDGAYTLEATTP